MAEDINASNGRALRIGLTGGIASGKTTVAGYFAGLGVKIIDTDVIAREIVTPGGAALQEIRDRFGAEVIAGDGTLDRKAMRRIVFADNGKRAELEAILHPRIRVRAIGQAQASSDAYVIIVVPLLAESPIRDQVDRVLVVDCSETVQLERLLERDAENEAQARRMMHAQASRNERLAIADDVIVNDDDLGATRRQVEALHDKYLALSAARCA